MIGNKTSLIKTLRGGHGGFCTITETTVSFNLESSSGERHRISLSSLSLFDILNDKISGSKLGEKVFYFILILRGRFFKICIKDFGRIRVGDISSLIRKLAGNFKGGFCGKFFDFTFFFNNKTKGWRLYTASGFSTGDFFTNDIGEVVTYKHIQCLAGLLAGDHIHINSTRISDSGLKSSFCNFVKSDTVSSFRKF